MIHDQEEDLRRALRDLPVPDYDDEMIERIIANPRAPRRGWGLGIALLAVVLMAGTVFTQQSRSYLQPLGTPSASATAVTSGPAPTQSSSAQVTTPSQTPTPSPTTETSETTTGGSGSNVTAIATPGAGGSIDPALYRSDGASGSGWYFGSPSGNFLCAITDDGLVGCEPVVPVAGQEECFATGEVSIVSYRQGDAMPTIQCGRGGVFVVYIPGGTGRSVILPYGSALAVNGQVCESKETGVSCYPEGTNGGFIIASQGITLPA